MPFLVNYNIRFIFSIRCPSKSSSKKIRIQRHDPILELGIIQKFALHSFMKVDPTNLIPYLWVFHPVNKAYLVWVIILE
jgi:hypothetical protein